MKFSELKPGDVFSFEVSRLCVVGLCIDNSTEFLNLGTYKIGSLSDEHKITRVGRVTVEREDTSTMKDLAEQALVVQDACNLSGVVHSWSNTITRLRQLLPNAGTDAINRHPVNVLFADKCHSLTNPADSISTYGKAYKECRELAGKENTVPVTYHPATITNLKCPQCNATAYPTPNGGYQCAAYSSHRDYKADELLATNPDCQSSESVEHPCAGSLPPDKDFDELATSYSKLEACDTYYKDDGKRPHPGYMSGMPLPHVLNGVCSNVRFTNCSFHPQCRSVKFVDCEFIDCDEPEYDSQ